LRYVLAATMPETSDADFTWHEYVRRNNNELVGTYGNLVHRVLTMVSRNFGGKVPQPGPLDESSVGLLSQARQSFEDTGDNIAACRFRTALSSAMGLAQAANRYLNEKAPWQAIKTDRQDAATTLWVGLSVINCLKTALYPFLPFSSEKLHQMLGLQGSVQDGGWSWEPQALAPRHAVARPAPLFTKLDEAVIEEEAHRMQR
jgi:methionyl-tRNA synthetase